MRCTSTLLLSALAFAACKDETKYCEPPEPPPEALFHVGDNDGVFVLPGGRRLTPTGQNVSLGGFPDEVALHPTLDVAYVNNTGYAWRGVDVIKRSDGTVLQSFEQTESFHGMSLSADGSMLYVAGGAAAAIDAYAVDPTTGMLGTDTKIGTCRVFGSAWGAMRSMRPSND